MEGNVFTNCTFGYINGTRTFLSFLKCFYELHFRVHKRYIFELFKMFLRIALLGTKLNFLTFLVLFCKGVNLTVGFMDRDSLSLSEKVKKN